jgi:phosphopantetheine--protein transferase-like protein
MKMLRSLNLKVPILYVNPPLNPDPTLVEEVSRAGGLGIVDHATGPAGFHISNDVPHGVRIRLEDAAAWGKERAAKLLVLPLEDADRLGSVASGALGKYSAPVIAEVGSAEQAVQAENAGVSGVIARGYEGPGWVSETCGFVLLQEILAAVRVPVFLQGGIGLETAAGAITAGAAGIVLDVHLLLAEGSAVSPTTKEFLKGLGLPATVTLAEGFGPPVRVYSRAGTRMVRELRKVEASLSEEDIPRYRERLTAAMRQPVSAPDSDEALLPLSENVTLGRRLATEFKTASGIVAAFAGKMAATDTAWPFPEDSALCRKHETRFPVVQGPMAHISDNPHFLAAVAEAGALPCLAMGNMPPPIAREGIALAREETGGKFGVGLIGLEVNRSTYEAHLEIMRDNPPPFAILAAGSIELAQRIEKMGTACYLHCPAPAVVGEALKAGLRHFVFEGCESGGHVGLLGSLDLWTANLAEVERAAAEGIPLQEVSILLAGGIASGRAAAFVAGMVSDLSARGLSVGLQMGTAYLTTEEAVATCAITSTYRDLTLENNKTVIIGRTVNIRARAAGSPAAQNLIDREQERLRGGLPLRERKEDFEKDNLGGLRLAAKGCAIDPETATWDCPVFCDLPPEDQRKRGVYLMGQAVSLLEKPCTMETLHREIVEEGRRIFEQRPVVEMEQPSVEERPEDIHPQTDLELPKEPIAIVGIGLHFPGANSPDTFWEQIVTGRSGIVEVPVDRWENPNFFYDPDPKAPDRTYSRIGGFVTDFVFNPLAYRIPPSVAKKMDRTQQMAVSCVGHALEDAGLSAEQLKGKKVGIILGNSMGGGETTDRYAERLAMPRTLACLEAAFETLGVADESKKSFLGDFQSRYLENLPEITEDSLPGELANVISGRVANVFNLEGPNFTVDAACASSMAAVMNAVASLREGKIDFALTGGVDAAMHPSSFIKFCKVGALSPDGSRPFDEGANGFVMGEGVGVVVLKRLSDAVHDQDRIYATILDIGSSSDGRGKGITAPNAAGQERAVRACLEGAGIDPNSVGLIEAHGTSTPVGDKTELMVLDRIFREAGASKGAVGIGSVKSQIGHLKAAAGAAGMIKAALSLYHRTLPPTTNVRRPNPCIDWESSPLRLITEGRAWELPDAGIRRAGISAFGFGGTNFHVIFQEHVPGLRLVEGKKKTQVAVTFSPPNWPKPPRMDLDCEAWILGGNNAEEVEKKIQTLLGRLNPGNAADLASRYREEAARSELRFGFAAPDVETTVKKLELIRQGLADPSKAAAFPTRGIHACQGSSRRAKTGVAFLFPGQGSQYPFMLRDLAERFPIVAHTLQEADEVLTSLGLQAVTAGMFPAADRESAAADGDADPMKDTQFLQPMILAANTAMFRLLTQMGVRPVAAAGHSLGEYAACVAAGVFSFRDALEAVAVRGREMARVSIADPGLMMSIPADARLVEEVLAEVDGYVVPANKNSPKQTVISGETLAVKKAGELFRARGLEGVLLPVSAAFHSGVVAPAREPFMKTLERLDLKPPLVPVLSNVTGDFYPVGPAAPAKIRDLLGKQFAAPVEWVKTLRRLYSDGVRLFVECGPKRVLTNLTLDTLPANEVLALPSNHPKKGGVMQLMEALAALAAEGVPVDFTKGEEPAMQALERRSPGLTVVSKAQPVVREVLVPAPSAPHPLDALMDQELRDITAQRDFRTYLEMQVEPIRALLKTGYQSYVAKVLPLEKTVRQVESEGMDFRPVVVSGLAAGLPSDVRFPFDRDTLDDLILGRNFIKKVPEFTRSEMLEKNIQRLVKGPSGEAELQVVDDMSGVLHLAGFFTEENVIEEYGLDERIVRSMDVTTRLAIAAGIEALRDAGIPLVQLTRTTTTGGELPEAWTLPPALRDETGIIFASAFPGMASMVDEVTRETAARYGAGAKKRLIEFYTGVVQRISDDRERERITAWFAKEFSSLNPTESEELYTFNRDFLLKVMIMAQGQLAQLLKAHGPNTHVDAACASTTQAIVMARDWVRTGRAKRVIVVAADDVAGRTLFPWVGSGFLAMGAATTSANVSEAALPFDDRRHGLILGSAAAGIVVEREDLVRKRGVDPIASIEAGTFANSGYHATRLDVEHISSVMKTMISKWEEQTGISRDELAKDVFFMSHETYSPKRGGSAAAEIRALRDTFGDKAKLIPIANTKGLTGHAMGVGVEDAVALRCLQKQMLPPIPNLKHPDPEFADLNLSKGGACQVKYALRLAAGFGSQVVMALYKSISREENRLVDLPQHRTWLKEITGYTDPVISVAHRTLHVSEKAARPAGLPAEIVAKAAEPVQQPSMAATITARAQTDSASATADEVRDKILALLTEKTGYPAEMLDTGLDLEADLGIDTVKQAEFISEVREHFHIPRIEGLKIAEFPTIEHIIRFVMQHVEGPASSEGEGDAAARSFAGEHTAQDEAEARDKILALLAEKTGYPPDMLDTGLDLEADLGIDTVKQAEFISEVREHFHIPRIEGLKIADFPTINHIIGFVLERRSEPAQEVVPAPAEPQADANSPDRQEVALFEARLVPLGTPDGISLPEAEEVLVVGGPADMADDVLRLLKEIGYLAVRRVQQTSLPDGLGGKKLGIVNLSPMDNGTALLGPTLELYVSCAKLFDQGPSFLVTAVSEDGALGFEKPAANGHILGSVTGATKAFGREFPQTLTRVLDLHPDLTPSQVAAAIGRSLAEAFSLEVAVGSDGELKVVRLVPVMEEGLEPGLNSGDVVLVTGGARGITAECVRFLAEQKQLTIVLLGRTPLSSRAEQLQHFGAQQWNEEKMRIAERLKREGQAPTPVMVEKELGRLKGEAEVSRTIRELRAIGSEVLYRALDIRDGDAVDRVIQEVAETCKGVDLVIHAAGIDASRALRSKTVEQMEALVAVKVQGMLNLMRSLEKHEMLPRRIIGFGSVSGRFGNMAQVDYSAANDGLAHLLRKVDRDLDGKASIIDWAPWAEIGMATRGSVQQSLEAAGIDFIPPRRGAELLAQEITRSTPSAETLVAGRVGSFESEAFSVPGSKIGERTLFAGQHAKIVAFVPGEYMRATVALKPSHPVLDDHRINRAAVFPGVGGMEVMRAAATTLNPEAAFADWQDVRFKGPIKVFKDDPFHAEVEAIRVEGGSPGEIKYFCRIFSWFTDKSGRRVGAPRLHHECSMVVGPKREAPAAEFPVWQDSVWVSESDIYAVFFHGPAFKLLDHLVADAAGTGIHFGYQDTPQRPDMFMDPIPAAVEAVFQAGAAAGLESDGIMTLPVGVARARVYQTDVIPRDGRILRIGRSTLQGGPEGRAGFRYDATVRDSEGRAVVVLEGIEMMELQPMAPFPGRVFQTLVPKKEVLGQLEQSPDGFLQEHLADDEIQEHASKKTPKRAEDWLVGRMAAKRCVRRVLSEADEQAPAPRQIRIVQDDLGKPAAELASTPGLKVSDVSLSHSNGMAVAVAAAPETFLGLGVDVEKIESRSGTWEEDYFTDEEIRTAGETDTRDRTLTGMWSLKEALVKALGTGLRFDLKDIRVTDVDDRGRAVLELRNEAQNYLRKAGGGTIEARVDEQEDMVIAKVLIRKE